MQHKNPTPTDTAADDPEREGEALMARVALTDAEVDAEIAARQAAEVQA